MVTPNMLRTCERKRIFLNICDSFQSKQRPLTDQTTDFTPYVRANFLVTISYKNHGFGCQSGCNNFFAKDSLQILIRQAMDRYFF